MPPSSIGAAPDGDYPPHSMKRRPKVLVIVALLVGALLFYAAHAKALLVIGQVGCLLLACAAFVFVLLRACVREVRS